MDERLIEMLIKRIQRLEEQVALLKNDQHVIGVMSSFMPRAEVHDADIETD